MGKRCNGCSRDLPRSGFYMTAKDKPAGQCKECACARARANRQSRHTACLWRDIMRRCYDPNNAAFENYGHRGVDACQRWRDKESFVADIGTRPFPAATLDRVDNNGGYWCGGCADCLARGRVRNVRWATRTTQARNRRSNRLVTIDGVTRPLSEWAELHGIKGWLASQRINRDGWSEREALTVPPGMRRTRAA